MDTSDLIAGAAAVLAGISTTLLVIQAIRSWIRRPPGGISFSADFGDGEATIVFGALGSWVFYDVRFTAHDAVIVSEGQAYDQWPPMTGVSVIDTHQSARVRLLYRAEREPESATVEITWVSGQDRWTEREGIRCNLETRTYEKWRRYRVQLGRKKPGRWVEYKRPDGLSRIA